MEIIEKHTVLNYVWGNARVHGYSHRYENDIWQVGQCTDCLKTVKRWRLTEEMFGLTVYTEWKVEVTK